MIFSNSIFCTQSFHNDTTNDFRYFNLSLNNDLDFGNCFTNNINNDWNMPNIYNFQNLGNNMEFEKEYCLQSNLSDKNADNLESDLNTQCVEDSLKELKRSFRLLKNSFELIKQNFKNETRRSVIYRVDIKLNETEKKRYESLKRLFFRKFKNLKRLKFEELSKLRHDLCESQKIFKNFDCYIKIIDFISNVIDFLLLERIPLVVKKYSVQITKIYSLHIKKLKKIQEDINLPKFVYKMLDCVQKEYKEKQISRSIVITEIKSIKKYLTIFYINIDKMVLTFEQANELLNEKIEKVQRLQDFFIIKR